MKGGRHSSLGISTAHLASAFGFDADDDILRSILARSSSSFYSQLYPT
jgi:hypothetical protein